MASNLGSIGFHFADDAAFAAAMTRLAGEAQERVACAAGDYAIWRCRSGASIWFHLAEGDGGTREIVGLTPFFEGKSGTPVKVMSRIARAGDNSFEGGLYVWIAPDESTGDENDHGAYPAVLDAIDFAAIDGHPLPFVAEARICLFARELAAYPTEAAFAEARSGEGSLAPQAFVPLGLFATGSAHEPASGGEPTSAALLTGRVAEHRLLTNSATGRQFHWLLVESFAASFDVLADPAVVTGAIAEGGTVEVSGPLFARLG